MINLLIKTPQKPKILCLGAHCDDIEIGCGGTLLNWQKERAGTHIYWVTFSSNAIRETEARSSANAFLRNAGRKDVILKNFPESYFPCSWKEIKDCFEDIRKCVSPDIIFTHYSDDRHQDHRIISDLTWNTFRDHLILEYEIPKYDGDMGHPNLYSPLDDMICRRKVDIISKYFRSQSAKHWFTGDLFYSLMRIRGMEAGPSCYHAEAFYCKKMIFR